jgi:hypothetical protein
MNEINALFRSVNDIFGVCTVLGDESLKSPREKDEI